MDVAVLHKHLSDLAGTLQKADASQTVVNGIKATAEALAPFAGYRIEQFAAFLKVVDEYRKAGVTPDKVPRATTTRASAPRKAAVSPTDAVNRVEKLYHDILNPNVTAETIEQELALLDGLTKPHLLAAAERIGIQGKVAKYKVGDMKAEIKKTVRDRRGVFQRPTY